MSQLELTTPGRKLGNGTRRHGAKRPGPEAAPAPAPASDAADPSEKVHIDFTSGNAPPQLMHQKVLRVGDRVLTAPGPRPDGLMHQKTMVIGDTVLTTGGVEPVDHGGNDPSGSTELMHKKVLVVGDYVMTSDPLRRSKPDGTADVEISFMPAGSVETGPSGTLLMLP